MSDPVTDTNGHSYEKAAIKEWLSNHDTSPVTGALLSHKTVVPNHSLRNAIINATTAPVPKSTTALRDASSRMNRESTKTTKTRNSGAARSQEELDLENDFAWDDPDAVREVVLKSLSLKAQLAIATTNLADTKRSLIDSNRLFLSELKYVFVNFDAHRPFAGVLLLFSTLLFRSKVSIGFL
jgi:hypothetical protein